MTYGSLLFRFSFFIQNIHKHAHYIMKYLKFPILKYVQVNVFGRLNTFIMTVLVDLYRVMGATMLVRAESELWDLQHANSSSPPKTH